MATCAFKHLHTDAATVTVAANRAESDAYAEQPELLVMLKSLQLLRLLMLQPRSTRHLFQQVLNVGHFVAGGGGQQRAQAAERCRRVGFLFASNRSSWRGPKYDWYTSSAAA